MASDSSELLTLLVSVSSVSVKFNGESLYGLKEEVRFYRNIPTHFLKGGRGRKSPLGGGGPGRMGPVLSSSSGINSLGPLPPSGWLMNSFILPATSEGTKSGILGTGGCSSGGEGPPGTGLMCSFSRGPWEKGPPGRGGRTGPDGRMAPGPQTGG